MRFGFIAAGTEVQIGDTTRTGSSRGIDRRIPAMVKIVIISLTM